MWAADTRNIVTDLQGYCNTFILIIRWRRQKATDRENGCVDRCGGGGCSFVLLLVSVELVVVDVAVLLSGAVA